MMEAFSIVLFLFAVLCLFCLLAAAAKKDIDPFTEDEGMAASLNAMN